MSESKITVEHLIEDGDVQFSLKRDEMHHLCADLLDRFKALIASVMSQLPQTPEGGAGSVDAVEVLGGGVRMPVVQQTITHFVGEHVTLGAKLDDGAYS